MLAGDELNSYFCAPVAPFTASTFSVSARYMLIQLHAIHQIDLFFCYPCRYAF